VAGRPAPPAAQHPLSDLEIGVLREIVPDIDQLTGRPGDPIPPLSGADGRRRLAQTILAVLRRQPQPTLLILEDLQWTQESLAPLQEALAQAHDLPLLIVGSYRTAEAPNLPAQFPGAALLTLDPLDRPQIAALSTAVLGRAADDASLLDFLAWSSEGNAFFVIELLRTISEQASQISELSQAGARYAAAGMEQIVQERLERLPSALQALLKLAAVSGRQLDLTLLVELVETKALDHWLYAALDAGLLEVFAGQWRFAHDKLREGILAGLLPEELTILHEQVAAGLEQAYPDDPGYALTLAQHWQAAGQPEKMTAYAVIAAAQMIQRSSFAEALALLQAALPQTADPLRRARIQYELGHACEGLGKREQAVAYLQDSLTAYRQANDRAGVMQTLNVLGQVYSKQGEFIPSLELLKEALSLARELGDQAGLAHALLWLGDGLYMAYEDAAGAAVYLQEALTAARASGDSVLVGRTLNIMGEHRRYLGQYPEAELYYQEALPLYEKMGHVWGIAIINTNMGHIMRLQGRTAVAWEHYRAALRALRQQGMLAASWELLAGAAGLLLLEGNAERAAQILALVHNQPDLDVDARNIAAPIAAQVAEKLSEGERERATAVGQRLEPVQLVTELIG
jgi:tetratricopeptide (TPR) repeat protein